MAQLRLVGALVFRLISTNKVRSCVSSDYIYSSSVLSTYQLSSAIGIGRIGVEEVTHSKWVGDSRY